MGPWQCGKYHDFCWSDYSQPLSANKKRAWINNNICKYHIAEPLWWLNPAMHYGQTLSALSLPYVVLTLQSWRFMAFGLPQWPVKYIVDHIIPYSNENIVTTIRDCWEIQICAPMDPFVCFVVYNVEPQLHIVGTLWTTCEQLWVLGIVPRMESPSYVQKKGVKQTVGLNSWQRQLAPPWPLGFLQKRLEHTHHQIPHRALCAATVGQTHSPTVWRLHLVSPSDFVCDPEKERFGGSIQFGKVWNDKKHDAN